GVGPQRARELVVTVRLPVAPLLLEAPPECVVGVVAHGRDLEQLPELRLGLRPAAEAEVGDPERLADRGLLRLAPLRLLERDGGLCRHAAPQVLASFLEEAVRALAHSPSKEG